MLIAPLAAVSAISVAQYVARPDFDFPGYDEIKEYLRLQRVTYQYNSLAAERAAGRLFPGHLGAWSVDHAVYKTLAKRGFNAKNTLFATSVCPDEVNTKNGELPDLMKTRYGESFPLGGLGGIPFTGTAGFTAYSHHAPDNLKEGGKMLILFAPHVGIQADGTVGKLQRPAQKTISTACGAAVGAYNEVKKKAREAFLRERLRAGREKSGMSLAELERMERIEDDVEEEERGAGTAAQFEQIQQALNERLQGIEEAADPIAFVTYQMFVLQKEFFVKDLKEAPAIWDFADELTILGGIQINRAKGGDRFMPLIFQTRKKEEGTTVDLFPETFGRTPDLSEVIGGPERLNSVLVRQIVKGQKL